MIDRCLYKWLLNIIFLFLFSFHVTVFADEVKSGSLLTETNYLYAFILILLLVVFGLIKQSHRLRVAKTRLDSEAINLRQQINRNNKSLERLTGELNNRIVYNKALIQEKRQLKLDLASSIEDLDATMDYIDSIESILIATRPSGSITLWNSDAERATGITRQEALSKSIEQVYPELPISLVTIHQVVHSQEKKVLENYEFQINQNMERKYIDLTVYPLVSKYLDGVLIRVDDVTFRVQLENMIIQSDKMRSLGELSTGMAHELNNPLGVVVNSAQNALRRLSPQLPKNKQTADELGIDLKKVNQYLRDRQITSFIENILEAGNRATSIAKGMLEYSRAGQRHTLIDLNELIERSLDLVLNSFGSADRSVFECYTRQLELSKDLPPTLCSGIEIQQVLINLINNASHALKYSLPGNTKPTLSIKSYALGQSAVIEVADNGIGMTENVARKIFEPFFTTKKTNEGTGLGLSVSYFIVTNKHKGKLSVKSAPNKGTRFIVELPIED